MRLNLNPDIVAIRVAYLSSLLFCLSVRTWAQACPHEVPDYKELAAQVLSAESPDIVFRAAAVGEEQIIPVLRYVSTPNMALSSSAGAAQVSLAKLGDKISMSQLQHEVNDARNRSVAVAKLVRVGDDEAISILMNFVVAHFHDSSLVGDVGDYGYDVRSDILSSIQKQLQIGPLESSGKFSISVDKWIAWWKERRGKVTPAISDNFDSSYLRCLARKIAWGFPNAILDLSNSGDPQVIPVLQKLAMLGDVETPKYSLGTIRGNAIFGLAKLGDDRTFQDIESVARGLGYYGTRYADAITFLQLIGGKRAVAALIDALDSADFLKEFDSRYPGVLSVPESRRDRDARIVAALSNMVHAPPRVTGNLDIQVIQWTEWWAKNKDTAVFMKPPAKSYE